MKKEHMNQPKLRYALIGCGRISRNHIAAVFNHKNDLELCAICDLVPGRMEALLGAFDEDLSTVRRYTDYREMLEKESLDLVSIATESGKHAAIALQGIAAGCHVIVEKPIALSLADADAMIQAAERKGVVLCACHQNRFNRSIQKIRSAVESGRFGKMLHGAAHIRWYRGSQYYKQAAWRGTWEQDGGALMNQCIHNIDLLRWMLGDTVEEVMAYTDRLAHSYIEAEDIGLALVKFHNGAYGLIEGTTNVFRENLEETLYLFGEKGTAKAGGKSVNVIEEWRFGDGIDTAEAVKEQFRDNPPNVYGFGHTPLYGDVIHAIRSKAQPYVDGNAGRRALELVLAIYRSAAEGKPVRLPLSQCATVDFQGRF